MKVAKVKSLSSGWVIKYYESGHIYKTQLIQSEISEDRVLDHIDKVDKISFQAGELNDRNFETGSEEQERKEAERKVGRK